MGSNHIEEGHGPTTITLPLGSVIQIRSTIYAPNATRNPNLLTNFPLQHVSPLESQIKFEETKTDWRAPEQYQGCYKRRSSTF